MRTVRYTVTAEYDNRKVLHYLRGCAGLSSSLIRTLKTVPNGINLNGTQTRTIDFIREGDIIEINIPDEKCEITPIKAYINVIYEDEDLIAVNKSSDMAVHPTHNHQGDTLANAIVFHLEEENKVPGVKFIGRLDKQTSGIVICALNKLSACKLSGNVEKEYLAVVKGIYEGSGTIDRPIIRPYANKTLRAVGEGGDRAVTHWESVKIGNDYSVLKIKLETGRTHQIRVHFMSLNTPLVGDDMYGGADPRISRVALHCTSASLIHPVTGERMILNAEIPDDLKQFL